MSATRSWRPEEVSTRARIRDAAVALFAAQGFECTSVRAIAQRAGVSAALVIHHFGTKDALRQACDDWVLANLIRDRTPITSGPGLPLHQMGQHSDHLAPLVAYLAASFRDGGALAQRCFAQICDQTDEMLSAGLAAGTMREPADREATVAALAAHSVGATILGDLIAARLGGKELAEPSIHERYAMATIDLLRGSLGTGEAGVT